LILSVQYCLHPYGHGGVRTYHEAYWELPVKGKLKEAAVKDKSYVMHVQKKGIFFVRNWDCKEKGAQN